MIRHLARAAIFLASVGVASIADAQINAQIASPVASDTFYVTPDARLSPDEISGGFNFSFDYGRLPLVYREGDEYTPVISDLATADVVLHVNLARRFRAELILPFNMSSESDTFSFAGLGDVRLTAQATLLDPARHLVGLAIRPFVAIPSGDVERYLGEGHVSVGGSFVAHRVGRHLQLATAIGARWLGSEPAASSQLLGSIGLSVPLDDKLSLGAEAFGATRLSEPFAQSYQSPLEVMGTAHYHVRPGMTTSFGVGTSVTEGAGGPRLRAYFQLAAVFPTGNSDQDADGIVDRADACPRVPEDRDGVLDLDGCPDNDNDLDGLVDDEDLCPMSPEDVDGFLDQDGCPDPDNDDDGLADKDDQCPDVSEDQDGFADEDGCPDADNDRDGTADRFDECPDEKEDFDGFQDFDGCPDLDNDQDGIVDAEDSCPNEAADESGPSGAVGCPKVATEEPDEAVAVAPTRVPLSRRLELSRPVLFSLDSHHLSHTARSALEEVVVQFRNLPSDRRLKIIGHCDDRGTDEYNDTLSLERAEAVKSYLISRGLDSHQIETIGLGRRQPLVKGRDPVSRRQNRRVEIWLIHIDGRKTLLMSDSSIFRR